MRILISILVVFGCVFIVVRTLLGVLHELLIRTTDHVPSEFDRAGSVAYSKVWEDVQ